MKIFFISYYFKHIILFYLLFCNSYVHSQDNVPELDIEITEGVVEPIPIAFPDFITDDFSSSIKANEISKIIQNENTNVLITNVLNTRLHGREPVRGGAHDRAEAPAGGLCAHASWVHEKLGAFTAYH